MFSKKSCCKRNFLRKTTFSYKFEKKKYLTCEQEIKIENNQSKEFNFPINYASNKAI